VSNDKVKTGERSPATIAARLGDYTAPQGLYAKTHAMPFLGRLTCSHDRLVAGEWAEILLDYEVGASGIADGAWLKIAFKFYSDWALFQTTDPKAANYVSVEYRAGPLVAGQGPATVQALKVRFDQKGHERPFQKAILIDAVDGFLSPSDHVVVRLGDRRFGGPGTRVQTFVETGFTFRAFVDPLGTSKFAPVVGDVRLDVVPGPAAALVAVGSRLVRTGEPLPLRIRAEDAWGNCCWNLGGALTVGVARDGGAASHATLQIPSHGWAVAVVDDLPTETAGELTVSASLEGKPGVPETRFFVRIDDSLAVPRVWYADLHVHSDDTIGTNDTRYNLTYGRDVAGLDVLGYTANDFNITHERWDRAVALIHELHTDGSFVCFPGTEWCGNSCAGGDHNVVFLHGETPEFPFDRNGHSARSFEWNEEMQTNTIVPGAWPLEELWATYAHDPEGHLLIPHVGGRRANLDWHYPALEKLIEVGSSWGHFPWFFQDAVSRGYLLGASAAGDEHRGRCGGGVPGTAVFGTKGGVTGVLAPALNRADIGAALRARHTWATTGERLVGLISSADHIQGDAFDQAGKADIDYRFLGDAGWDHIAAYDHTGLIWERDLQREAGYSDCRIRLRWGGARIKDRYRWAEWRGTITLRNAVIHSIAGLGFENREENCWREGATVIGFRSDTYGDADAIEIDASNLANATITVEGTIDGYSKIGDPAKGHPFEHCPSFHWEVSGADLLSGGRLGHDLGGVDLFLALERLTDQPLPREVSGRITVEAKNGPHGFRPVYFAARQIDDAKVWTSPLYITFG
jgi:hypothetical protein